MERNNKRDLRDGRYKVFLYQSNTHYAKQLAGYMAMSGLYPRTADRENVLGLIPDSQAHVYIFDLYDGPGKILVYKGLDLLIHTRELNPGAGIIMLSEDIDLPSRLQAYREGADDVVELPFNFDELICKVRALGARTGIPALPDKDRYVLGPYLFSPNSKILDCGPQGPVMLDDLETKALELLAYNKGGLVTYKELSAYITGKSEGAKLSSLSQIVSRLRGYLLGSNIVIRNTHGQGYTLEDGK